MEVGISDTILRSLSNYTLLPNNLTLQPTVMMISWSSLSFSSIARPLAVKGCFIS